MGRHRKVVEFVDAQVPFALTEPEQRTKAFELAQLCGEIDKLRADAADGASVARKRIRALEKRRRILAECVRTGTEMRNAQEDLFGKPLRSVPGPPAPQGTVDLDPTAVVNDDPEGGFRKPLPEEHKPEPPPPSSGSFADPFADDDEDEVEETPAETPAAKARKSRKPAVDGNHA